MLTRQLGGDSEWFVNVMQVLDGKDKRPQDGCDGLENAAAAGWTASDSASLTEVVQAASEAVTTLADRLNALALRAALLGGVADSFGAESNVEGYLNRLCALVESAGDQMRRIQKVLQVLETATLQTPPGRSKAESEM